MEAVESTSASVHEGRPLSDEQLAARFAVMRLLITAECPTCVESIARRVHIKSAGAASPFIKVSAAALPTEATTVSETLAKLLHTASGGSLLLMDIQEMPAAVQSELLETLTQLQRSREGVAGVRLMAGTTKSLRDWVAAGAFSERLFYRLNTIHLVAVT